MLSNLSKVINNVKDVIQTNVQNIANNLSNKPTLGGRITLGNRELEEIKLISQGGYAYIFQVKDIQTEETFALKKMICQNNERLRTAKNEISILKSLPSHPNILRLHDAQIVKVSDGHHAYILLELCEEGSLFDMMVKYESTKLNEKQIIFIMREICDGVKALHSCEPPIVHRDLKIENVLLHNKHFKLCDFGSCSSKFVDFGQISQKEYAFYEEEYDKNTTLMYRPPEMCDPYQRFVVNDRVDVWMLGCILYTLCFYKQPFQECSKLSIVNAAFTFPKEHSYPDKLIDIIRIMLTPNPKYRPSIFELSNIFNDYFSIESIQLNDEALKIKEEAEKKEHDMKGFTSGPKKNNEGDIPIEELMNLQKKVQKSQKNNKKEPEFKEWKKVQYPQMQSTKSAPAKSNDEWGDFSSSKFDSAQNEQVQGGSNAFDAFGDFSSGQNVNKDNTGGQQWNNFDFGVPSSNQEAKSGADNSWSTNLWDAPQFDNKQDKNSENNKEESQKKLNNDFDSFDFFAGTTVETSTTEKKEETGDFI